MLSYVQSGLADNWKENTLKDLERGLLEYEIVEEFLAGIRIIEKFVQEFRRMARRSEYKKRPLVKEFKREINANIY